jgi:hypothetical protein
MAGLVSEHLINGQMPEASGLVSEQMVLIDSIGDPALTVGLALFPAAVKIMTGEVTESLRWSDRVIDLAEGDRAMGGYILGSPLAFAYALRSTARWWLGHPGWRQDFERAIAMSRDADPVSRSGVIVYTYGLALGCGVITADDAVRLEIDAALESAERTADDIALGFALYTKANVLVQGDSAQRQRGLDLIGQVREMAVNGRFYASLVPAIDVRIADEAIRSGDRGAISRLRASIDEMCGNEMLGWFVWGTGVLVDVLLECGTAADVAEAETAVERLAAQPVVSGFAYCELILLRSRTLLARARGDEIGYRDFANRYRAMATSLGFEGHIAMAEAMGGADGIEPPTAGV